VHRAQIPNRLPVASQLTGFIPYRDRLSGTGNSAEANGTIFSQLISCALLSLI
jgi:hypothetical protein